MVGKAVYEGILVELPFAPFFLAKFGGRRAGVADLAGYDAQLYENVIGLRGMREEDMEALGLTFTVVDEVGGVGVERELKAGGAGMGVTAGNVVEYTWQLADYRLNR